MASANSGLGEVGFRGEPSVNPAAATSSPGARMLNPGLKVLGQDEALAAVILQGLCAPQQLKGHVMAACQLVEPGMGYAGITAANTGAARLPLGASCLVILGHLLTCYAQEFAPVPALVEAYLGLLSRLASLASTEHHSASSGRGLRAPLRLLSDCVQALITRLPLSAMTPHTLNHLLKVVLEPLPHADAALSGAATLWAVVQGCGVGPGGVAWPEWAQCVLEPWAHAWMYKITSRQRLAVLLHLINHCSCCLQTLSPQASTQACHLAPHDSPDDQAAPDKAAESASAPLATPSSSGTAQAGAQAGSEVAKAAGTLAHGPSQLVQGPVLEGPVGQALAEATVEMVLAVLRGSEDSERSPLGSDDVLTAVVQLASHMLTACTAAHMSLSAMVTPAAPVRAGSASAKAAAPSAVKATPCDVIDLTADQHDDDELELSSLDSAAAAQATTDSQDFSQCLLRQCKAERHTQAELPDQDMLHQNEGFSKQAEDLAQLAELPLTGLPDQARLPEPAHEDCSSHAAAADSSKQPEAEAQLEEGVMEDLCMLCAYGMDVAAVVSCLLNQVDIWPGIAAYVERACACLL
ncbi:hypothetical protein ABBQ32_003263 [Trebouxia sp. C0010 RCD-2024]